MSDSSLLVRSEPSDRRAEVAVMTAVAVVGLAYAARALSRPRTDTPHESDRRSALAAYLREHFAASEAALYIVAQLRDGHRGTPEAATFARLQSELREERRALLRVLGTIGVSALSLKRLATRAGGAAAGEAIHTSSDATLLRTLEGLCVGIQGKRCLWRALRRLDPGLDEGEPGFDVLEAHAIRQWEAVDAYRQAVAIRAFAI
jgi:hypothetical protein